jgi:hypothetical protein
MAAPGIRAYVEAYFGHGWLWRQDEKRVYTSSTFLIFW